MNDNDDEDEDENENEDYHPGLTKHYTLNSKQK